jgi:hypothetical protein
MSESSPTQTTTPARHATREWSIAAAVSACIGLAAVAPFFFLGTASGHDIAFHMASWLDAVGQWKQGVILPRWTEWANFGFGEPRFIFYPPLSWLFGAFLGIIVPWPAVPGVFIASAQTFAGLSAHALLRQVSDSRFSALLGAACFAANPYALLIIYMRSDFAELLALAFFPLLLLAALRLGGFVPGGKHGESRKIIYFAIPFCAVWLSNAPAGVIASYSVALIFAFAAARQRSFLPLANGAVGIILGFGLAALYLIPAIYEQRWVNITGALAGGLTPAENFLYAKTGDAEHDAFNRIASRVAVLLILWMILAAITAWQGISATNAKTCDSKFIVVMAMLGGFAALLMLPVSLIFWRFLPELRFVQFPWRLMSVLALCATVFTTTSARGWLRWAWLAIVAITIMASARYLVKNAWWDTEDMPALQTAMKDGAGFEGTDEYDPIGDDHTDLAQEAPRAKFLPSPADPEGNQEGRIVVENWIAEHRALHIVTRRPRHLALHLLNYPAWRVTLNGSSISAQHPRTTRQMIIQVPAGESELHIDFTRTSDRAAGGLVSFASLVTSLSVLLWRRRTTQTARD